MADGATGELGRIGLKRPDLFREHCYIDGEWVGEATHPVHNPATGGLIGRIPNLGKSETERGGRGRGGFARLARPDRQGARRDPTQME